MTQLARAELTATRPHCREPFLSVAVANIVPSTVVGVSLDIKDEKRRRLTLYRPPDSPFGEAELQRLRADGVSKLYVASHDLDEELLKCWKSTILAN